ncbi:putative MFS-type transporter YhjX [mine drainage metagenome]|uniref:Putative MFS-type transporter YhjX n=1 Tax=mine drainage metagenome TaxID=410659 RepID=A0A1J5S0N3_9ZZZZ
MKSNILVRLAAGRVHYGWIAAAMAFLALVCVAGVRATPGVLIVPLEKAFGWDRSTISSAIAFNLVLFGLMGPFAGAAMQRFGIRRPVLAALGLLALALALSTMMTRPWQLVLTWGLMVGLGAGVLSTVFAATVVNRWFSERRGLMMGVLAASTAMGQLIFLPLLAWIVETAGWKILAWTLVGILAALMPLFAWLMVERPEQLGLKAYGATVTDPGAATAGVNPILIAWQVLVRAARVRDFWLLFGSFFVCGLSTNGLIGTHFIAFCFDGGIPEVRAAGLLAMMGMFNLIGTTGSGWLSDRYDCRWLLFWYYVLRSVSLFYLPYSDLTFWGLSLFGIFYGLDWVATVPPTLRIATDLFGKRDAAIVFGWIFVGHQLGAGFAAFGGGAVRTVVGNYTDAFLAASLMCALAAMAVLLIARTFPLPAARQASPHPAGRP